MRSGLKVLVIEFKDSQELVDKPLFSAPPFQEIMAQWRPKARRLWDLSEVEGMHLLTSSQVLSSWAE